MATWVLLLIAIAAAVVIFAYRARKKDPTEVEDPESMESVTEGTDQIAGAGTDGPERASSILRPLSDNQTGENDGIDRASSILRPLPDSQVGHLDSARHALLGERFRHGRPAVCATAGRQ